MKVNLTIYFYIVGIFRKILNIFDSNSFTHLSLLFLNINKRRKNLKFLNKNEKYKFIFIVNLFNIKAEYSD